jgi:DNA-binding beta-propeller fold protein YncE
MPSRELSIRVFLVLFRHFFILAVVLVLAACAGEDIKPSAEKIYWPAPPDPPRFVYETTLRSEDSIKVLTSEDRFRRSLTGVVEDASVFQKPFDVAARNGSVVVTDTVARLGYIFNLSRQKLYRFGNVGREGVLAKPMGVAMDGQQYIYVADVGARRVFVYDAVGMYLRSIGGYEDLDRPVDVAVNDDGSQVYVVDAGGIESQRHGFVAYDGEGKKLFAVQSRGTEKGLFNLPTQAAVAPDGTVYILDGGNFRIQAFSPDGKLLRAWGAAGRNFGDLARPRGLAVDRAGNVYVSDAAYRNVQVFNPEGELLLALGGTGLMDEPGQYALPAGVAVDELDYVYVVDQLFYKVDVLRKLSEQEVDAVAKSRVTAVAQ